MRKKRAISIGAMILVGLSFLGGCVPTRISMHEEGLNYLNAQAYEQAVAKLTQAQAEDPDNPEITADLERAKELAAKQHFQTGSRLSDQNEINGALIEFEKARTYQPQNPIYVECYNQEKKRYDDLAATINDTVKTAMKKKEWKSPLQVLESMKIYESSFPDISQRIEGLRKEAANYYEIRSEQNLARQNYYGAYSEIEKATEYSEEESLKNKKKARHHLLLSNQAWKKKNYLKAYEEILKGLEFEPNHAELKRYEERLVGQWADILYNQAVQASNDGRLSVAKARLTRLSKIRPGYLDTEELLSDFQTTLASTYYTKAESLLNQEDRSWVGTALANYLLAREQHTNQYPELEEKIDEAKRLLRKEIELRISLDFKNKSEQPGAAGYVKDQILARLRNSKALKNVKILEREAIDEILREQGLGQAFLDETTSLTVKKIKGIQAGVKGEVIRVSVKESGRDRPSYGSSRYKSGTRLVPNPEYPRVQAEVPRLQQEVLSAQQELHNAEIEYNRRLQEKQQSPSQYNKGWTGAMMAITDSLMLTTARTNLSMTESALRQAQQRLANTPPQIEQDVYANYRYEIFDLKLEGEVVVSFRVINFTTSEIGKVRTIRKTGVASDRYIPGDPGKGVRTDPNELPTQEEFGNNLLAQAIDETFEAMEAELSTHFSSYYQNGVAAENDQLENDAIENYMRFIYSAPSLGDPRVQHANEYIYEKMGLRVVRRKT